jgi:Methyltransferase FkbM domain
MTLYELGGDTTLSTLNFHNAALMSKNLGLPIRTREINVKSLSSVMGKYCANKAIHFMSVDAEGSDLEVLQSNDWQKYRPEVIIVEGNNQFHTIVEFLDKNGYLLVYNNFYNCIFVNKFATLNKIKKLVQHWN